MLMKEPLWAALSRLLTRSLKGFALTVSAKRHVVEDPVEPQLERARGFLSRQLATTLTVVRLILGLVSAYAFNAKDYPVALALFVPSAFLDYLDGQVARRLDRVSPLGAFLDVACDWIVLVAYFAVMFSARALTILPFSLLMLAVSLLVIAHLARFFSQGSSTAEREIAQGSLRLNWHHHYCLSVLCSGVRSFGCALPKSLAPIPSAGPLHRVFVRQCV